MRDAFAVLFFVSIGILFRPSDLIGSVGLVSASLAVILVAKPLITMVVMRAFHYPLRTTLGVAMATAQIGEFSFILAASGKSLGIVDDRITSALVAAGIISITINPLLYRLIGLWNEACDHGLTIGGRSSPSDPTISPADSALRMSETEPLWWAMDWLARSWPGSSRRAKCSRL